MIELGFPRDKCIEVCSTGLRQDEVYYRIQAARLLTAVGDKFPLDGIDLEALIHDKEVGVDVCGALVHEGLLHTPYCFPVNGIAFKRHEA